MKICKKIVAVFLAVLLLSAFAACGKEVAWEDPTDTSASEQETTAPTTAPTAAPTVAPTTVPVAASTEVTTAAPTVAPTVAPTAVPTEATTAAPTVAPTEAPTLSEQEIMQKNIDTMCAAVNAVKHMTDFSAVKTQRFTFKITDCSVPFVIQTGNAILKRLCRDKDLQFNFVNGISKNPEKGEPDVTPNEAIPPTNLDVRLDPAGLVSLTVTQEGNNTVYTAIIAEEKVTVENPVPYYHALAMDYLDFSDIDISPAKIAKADITYYDATVKVSIDNTTGMLSGFEEITPISGEGAAELLKVTAGGSMEGSLCESWTFRF